MNELTNKWLEACSELWETVRDNPQLREEATVWDAFMFMYMKRVNPEGAGRRLKGGR